MIPSVGRIVHYRKWNGEVLPAIIVFVHEASRLRGDRLQRLVLAATGELVTVDAAFANGAAVLAGVAVLVMVVVAILAAARGGR